MALLVPGSPSEYSFNLCFFCALKGENQQSVWDADHGIITSQSVQWLKVTDNILSSKSVPELYSVLEYFQFLLLYSSTVPHSFFFLFMVCLLKVFSFTNTYIYIYIDIRKGPWGRFTVPHSEGILYFLLHIYLTTFITSYLQVANFLDLFYQQSHH